MWLRRAVWGIVVFGVFMGVTTIAEGLLHWSAPVRGQPDPGPALVFFGGCYLAVAAVAALLQMTVRR